MLYQLPTGKVIYLSLDDYLDLTDEDIQYFISTGLGDQPLNPFFGSSLNNKSSRDNPKDSIKDIDASDDYIDYSPEDDDINTSGPKPTDET